MTENIHFKIEGAYQHEAITNGNCFQRSWHLLKYKKALELIDTRDNEKILDAACGSGVLTSQLALTKTLQITGADFSAAAINFCRNHYEFKNVNFLLLDLKKRFFGENIFDKIVMLEVLEHLTPEVAAEILSNIYFYLKPGGWLVLSTPNKKSLWPAIEFMLDAFKLTPKMKDEQHVKLYNKKQLNDVLAKAGFQITAIESSHFLAPWVSFLGIKVAEKTYAFEKRLKVLPGSLLFAVAKKTT